MPGQVILGLGVRCSQSQILIFKENSGRNAYLGPMTFSPICRAHCALSGKVNTAHQGRWALSTLPCRKLPCLGTLLACLPLIRKTPVPLYPNQGETWGCPGGQMSRWQGKFLHSGEEATWQRRRLKRCGFHSWVGKIPWSRRWRPAPVSLPGKFHGQRSLAGDSHDWAHTCKL